MTETLDLAATPDRFLLAGVMGDPVMHSRSPAIFAYWFGKYGLAGSYLPLAIKPAGLRAALRALPALGFSGTNLTIPHKEAALAMVDRVDPVAQRIGAINCVVVASDGTLAGFNHDAFGYIASVREAQPALARRYRPDRGARRGRQRARRGRRPGRRRRPRHSRGQPHACARAGPGAGSRRGPSRRSPGTSVTRRWRTPPC